MNTVVFEPGSIPVSHSCDVLIVGGGTSGAIAGISSAREGANTLIVEQYGALGGSQTMALVTPIMSTCIDGDPLSSGISEEIRSRMVDLGAANEDALQGKGWFDPLTLKYILERIADESGCHILYHTTLIGVLKEKDVITHAVVYNADGITAVSAKVFIDATADGTLSVMSGAGSQSGDKNGLNQAVSLRFMMAGVQTEAFANYLRSLGDNNVRTYPIFHAASVYKDKRFVLEKVFMKAYEEGFLTLKDIKYFQCFSVPGKPDVLAFNCPELGAQKNILDAAFLSERQKEGKTAIFRIMTFLKRRIPGFEGAYLCEIAPMVGIRESRRIDTEYILTGADVARYARFDDYIATSNYPIDIHSGDGEGLEFEESDRHDRYYHVPYRSLVVKGIHNLLVVGRCLGADFVAQSSVRVQNSCRSTGEAAGIGAAMAIAQGCAVNRIDGSDVRGVMEKGGAKFV